MPNSLRAALWRQRLDELPPVRAALLRALRMGDLIGRDLASGELSLRATSLVYTTLLSFVPLLALAFSVLKGFGVHNQLEPALMQFLEPLGARGAEIGARIMGFVRNVKAGVLGSVGLVMLLYTVVSLLLKIEAAFNGIWQIRRARGLVQGFRDYLALVLVGPVLVFAALGITASAANSAFVKALAEVEAIGWAVVLASRLVPYVLIIAILAFGYMVIPNTRVRLRPALLGGLLAGVLWQSLGWAFARFVVTSTQYTAIYSSFAIAFLFIIWLYLSWMIVLLGASVAFYVQNPSYLAVPARKAGLRPRSRESLGLLLMLLVARRFGEPTPAWTDEALRAELGLTPAALDSVLQAFVRHGLLARSGDDPARYLPARDPARIPVADILAAIRGAGIDRWPTRSQAATARVTADVMARLEASRAQALADYTLADMAAALETAPAAPQDEAPAAADEDEET